MTFKEFKDTVEHGIAESLGHDAKEIAKTKAQEWYDNDIAEYFREAVNERKTRGAKLTDERYWHNRISLAVQNLIF